MIDPKYALKHLTETERDCVVEYLSLLKDRLAGDLEQVWLFGSAARGDMWPDWSTMHSDIDLLVLTSSSVPSDMAESLVNETYPLLLQCGRQISPQFRTTAEFHAPLNDRARDFSQRVQKEGRLIYSGNTASVQ